jgi:hypothetical protein
MVGFMLLQSIIDKDHTRSKSPLRVNVTCYIPFHCKYYKKGSSTTNIGTYLMKRVAIIC